MIVKKFVGIYLFILFIYIFIYLFVLFFLLVDFSVIFVYFVYLLIIMDVIIIVLQNPKQTATGPLFDGVQEIEEDGAIVSPGNLTLISLSLSSKLVNSIPCMYHKKNTENMCRGKSTCQDCT